MLCDLREKLFWILLSRALRKLAVPHNEEAVPQSPKEHINAFSKRNLNDTIYHELY